MYGFNVFASTKIPWTLWLVKSTTEDISLLTSSILFWMFFGISKPLLVERLAVLIKLFLIYDYNF